MPILRQDHVLEAAGKIVDHGNDVIAFRNS